jgi:tetratricopeptide (TPR) repeat protein
LKFNSITYYPPILIKSVLLTLVFFIVSCDSDELQEAAELNNSARELLKTDLSQAKVYAFSALEVATDRSDQFDSYYILGFIENELGNVGMAISHYMEAIELYPESAKSVPVRKNIGQIFYKLGNHNLAIYHFLQAYDYADELKKIDFMVLLGKSYMANEDFLTAGEYFQLAIKESKDKSLSTKLIALYNLEGLRYKKSGDIDKAREYYQLVISMEGTSSAIDEKVGVAYHNLGDSYLIEGNLQNASANFQKALQLKTKASSIYLTNMDLGECYLKLNQYELAEKHLMDAYESYSSLKTNPNSIKLFQHLVLLNQIKGNKDKALEYSNKFNSEMSSYYETRDRHLQATSIAAVKSFANLYEEGLSNKKVIKKTVYSIWAIAAGGVLSLVLMIMLWLRFVKRKSKMQYELMELIEGL